MRHLLALFPVDRADLDRHAATVRSHFATVEQRVHAGVIALCILALAANILALAIVIGERGQ